MRDYLNCVQDVDDSIGRLMPGRSLVPPLRDAEPADWRDSVTNREYHDLVDPAAGSPARAFRRARRRSGSDGRRGGSLTVAERVVVRPIAAPEFDCGREGPRAIVTG